MNLKKFFRKNLRLKNSRERGGADAKNEKKRIPGNGSAFLLVLLIGIYQMNLLPEATLLCCPTMEKRRFRVLRR